MYKINFRKHYFSKRQKEQASLTDRPSKSGKPHFGSDLGLLGCNYFETVNSTSSSSTLFQAMILFNLKKNS